jgi:hypothetical protein
VRRALAALLLACALAAAAACGGSSGDDASEGASTAAPPVAGLADRLPPQDALPGVRRATPRLLPTAAAFVAALYQAGEPTRAAALARLRAAGYAEGIVRDQEGTDPGAGAALVRSYAVRLRDDEAAREEAAAAVAEARDSPLAVAPEAVELRGVDGAAGLRAGVTQGGVSGRVILVTFPQGPYVQGIQAVSPEGADLPEAEILAAAEDLAARLGAP